MAPDWYSSPQGGGYPGFDDPRWGTGLIAFLGTTSEGAGGYVIAYDRAASELAVTIRPTLGPSETPSSLDSVYFGITTNQVPNPGALSASISLISLQPGEGPRSISSLQTSEYTTTWSPSSRLEWLSRISAWRGTQTDVVSWAVSFRVKLALASVDPTRPFRIAIALHADGQARDLSTPADFTKAQDRPDGWPLADLDPQACVGWVTLR
jgi:hypothetical protein